MKKVVACHPHITEEHYTAATTATTLLLQCSISAYWRSHLLLWCYLLPVALDKF
jgi:hypothetical protein